MAADFDRFLTPVSDDNPGGEDLDETGAIFTLDQAVGWSQAEPAEWRAVRDTVEDGLLRSRDLRLGVTMAAVLLNTEGIPAFAAGIGYLRSLLETFWDSLYPRVEEDGNADSRSNSLVNLLSFYKVIRPLQRAWLVEQPGIGRFSALDVDIAEGRTEAPPDYPPDAPALTTINAAFAAVDPAELAAQADLFAGILGNLAAIREIFETRVPDTGAPDLERLIDTAQRCQNILRSRLPEPPEETGDASAEEGSDGSGGAVGAPTGAVRSRRDALLAIERAARYFRDAEPTSPVPMLLDRAIKFAEADFLTIIEDIAPDALVNVKLLRGGSDEGE